jgi:chemotaxis protein methyltransferase CheR
MQPKLAIQKPSVAVPTDLRAIGMAEAEFEQFRAWIHELAGINLSEMKRALVATRLAPRLRHFQLASYGEYFRLLAGGLHPAEPQIAIDLLTTNETQFFREPKHFDFLAERILPGHPAGRLLRVWSAACSTGEEPYTIAMVLAAQLGDAPWEIYATDLSQRVLMRARTGHYAMARANAIAKPMLNKYCLKGVGAQAGTFLVDAKLRTRVQFAQVNLNRPLPQVGEFEVIFIRNAMIYFDMATKREVVARLVRQLKRGGYLIVGHSESMHGVNDELDMVVPSVYRK